MTVHVCTGELDLEARRFRRRDGAEHTLTATEAALLGHLAERIGEDVSRDELRAEVWGHHASSLSRAVDCAVKRLRHKIELDQGPPRALLTVHGTGYRLVRATPVRLAPPPPPEPRLLHLGRLDVDLDSGVLHGAFDLPSLTTQQLALLEVLAARAGLPVSPCVLARRLGLPTQARRAVNTAVYRLRQVIEEDPSDPQIVLHLRGRGFVLQADVRQAARRASRGGRAWTPIRATR